MPYAAARYVGLSVILEDHANESNKLMPNKNQPVVRNRLGWAITCTTSPQFRSSRLAYPISSIFTALLSLYCGKHFFGMSLHLHTSPFLRQ